MSTGDHEKDLLLAQETCTELRSGNNEAILNIYNKYHSFFLGYTRRRLHPVDYQRDTSILDDFWVELLNAKAICDYKGLASLKTYLFRILNFTARSRAPSAYRHSGGEIAPLRWCAQSFSRCIGTSSGSHPSEWAPR